MVGASGADGDGAAIFSNVVELGKLADIDERAGRG